MIFLKTGWMEFYRGDPTDKVRAQHSYVKEHHTGHESRNFLNRNGTCYGFAPFFRKDKAAEIGLERLGAADGAPYLDGVDVIWIARQPSGGVYVVGWYRNARLYRKLDLEKPDSEWYLASVSARDAHLIPIDERTVQIPVTPTSGPRSAAVYYGTPALRAAAATLIDGNLVRVQSVKKAKLPPDIERRLQVEKAAILKVMETFALRGFDVTSVEKENLGWDLEARKPGNTLCIEVKGSSLAACSPLLTPNELLALKACNASYRLCIVTDALAKAPRMLEFRYSAELNKWVEASGNLALTINLVESARLTVG